MTASDRLRHGRARDVAVVDEPDAEIRRARRRRASRRSGPPGDPGGSPTARAGPVEERPSRRLSRTRRAGATARASRRAADLEPAGERPRRVRGQRDLQPLLGDVARARPADRERRRLRAPAPRARAAGPRRAPGRAAGRPPRASRTTGSPPIVRRATAVRGGGSKGSPRTAGGRRAPVVEVAAQRLVEEVGDRRRRAGGHGGAGLPLLELVRGDGARAGRRRFDASIRRATRASRSPPRPDRGPAFHTDAVTSKASPGAAISRAETASSVTSAAEARAPSASAIFSSRSMAAPPSPSRRGARAARRLRQDLARAPGPRRERPASRRGGGFRRRWLRPRRASSRCSRGAPGRDLGRHRAQTRVDCRRRARRRSARRRPRPSRPRLVRARLLERAHVLRAVKAAARHRDLVDGASRERIDAAGLAGRRSSPPCRPSSRSPAGASRAARASDPPRRAPERPRGSPARRYASRAVTPAAWCWPWPSRAVPEKMVTTTCGRKRRMTRTASSKRTSFGQLRRVSSSERVKPKS